jgi:hypothetical protein
MLSHLVEYFGPGTGLTGTALALNIGGSSRLINIGTTSSISDLNIVQMTTLLDLTLCDYSYK